LVCDGGIFLAAAGGDFGKHSLEETAMNWGQPRALWMLLLFVPLLGFFLWWSVRRRQVLMRQFVSSRLLSQLTVGVSVTRQKIRALLIVLAVVFLILALARPEWGFTWEEATQRGRDIVVAIDTSRSMLASDAQPNRLMRAKLAALDLLRLGKRDRFALVAFTRSSFLQCPLTLDDEAFRQSVNILETGILPEGGTSLREAIETALTAFSKEEGENHRVLVIFTDGEDHESGIDGALRKAREEGLRIFTVGVGTPGGELLQVRDASGALNYVKDEQGNVVKSKLNEQLLKQIASEASGAYFHLEGAHTMDRLYQDWLAPLPTSEFSAKLVKHFKEQYYWPLAVAMLLLMIEIFLPDQRRRRMKENESIGLKTAALLALTVLSLNASPSRALNNYAAGDYKDALNEYERLLEKKPDDPRLHYNAGAAAYQAKKYDKAIKQFSDATAAQNLELQQMAYYNLGNAQFRLGESESDPQQKMGNWQDAVKNFDSALKLNPKDADAKYNRDFVQHALDKLKKDQKDKNKPDPNKDNKDNKDEKEKKDKNEQKDNKSDQNKKDDQQQQQKDNQEQQKQEQNKQNQEQKQEEQKQQQQQQQDQEKKEQASADQKKPGEKDQAQQNQGKPGEDKDQPDQQGASQVAKVAQMTPQQAQQLLEAQKGEERALIFLPQNQKRKNEPYSFKDW
jgi:Ca-activated chloride channel family protein